MDAPVMTTRDVAALLGCTSSTVSRYVHSHGLPAYMLADFARHGMRVYLRAEVVRWMRDVWPSVPRRGRPRSATHAAD